MVFEAKCSENLDAAACLLPDDARDDCFPNACASRAYYAAYLATAERMQRLGAGFTAAAGSHYRHDSLPEDAARLGILDEDDRDDLILLRDRRVKADYWEDNIDLEEASGAHEVAARLVQKLLHGSGT
ncbi:MAG TPA: hypothetical protein VGQ83_23135 [Polyangia bacterium]|jgi:hypothetical protein